MYKLTEKLRSLTPYDPITGDYKIRLDANESFLKLSDEDIKAAVTGLDLNRYPDPYATEVIKAYADIYGLNPDLITAGNGSDELISIITACFLEKGDKVLCFTPDFSMYSFYPYLYELDVEVMKKNGDLTIDVDSAIEYANAKNVKCIMFSNPCNPTSVGLEKADVVKLITSVKSLVVLDEAYMDFWGQENSLLGDIEKYDNVIILKTCSKALSMAGLRLGFAIGSPEITRAMRAAKSPYNVNSLTQALGAYALKDKATVLGRIEAIKKSIKELYAAVTALNLPWVDEIYKPVTNFLFIKTAKAKEVYGYLLENSIAIRFMGDYIRITCGTDEENRAVVQALEKFGK
ncbi:MAG: pyridoxal phosphate-dependent aminotransferase [Ruminiclostridium sp.]